MVTCPNCGEQDPEGARFCNACTTPISPRSHASSAKPVHLLFCDVNRSTSLGESTDAEALRTLLARYFERMQGIVESHGGTVEKLIGDAVMAVFGVPRVHEDDALRAVRAACEMRMALAELGGAGADRRRYRRGRDRHRGAYGDGKRVNVAAHLEQAARPGEILIGEPTLGLVRGRRRNGSGRGRWR